MMTGGLKYQYARLSVSEKLIAINILVFIVIGLEITIAFLQAYVFVVLLSIYLNDVINTH